MEQLQLTCLGNRSKKDITGVKQTAFVIKAYTLILTALANALKSGIKDFKISQAKDLKCCK